MLNFFSKIWRSLGEALSSNAEPEPNLYMSYTELAELIQTGATVMVRCGEHTREVLGVSCSTVILGSEYDRYTLTCRDADLDLCHEYSVYRRSDFMVLPPAVEFTLDGKWNRFTETLSKIADRRRGFLVTGKGVTGKVAGARDNRHQRMHYDRYVGWPFILVDRPDQREACLFPWELEGLGGHAQLQAMLDQLNMTYEAERSARMVRHAASLANIHSPFDPGERLYYVNSRVVADIMEQPPGDMVHIYLRSAQPNHNRKSPSDDIWIARDCDGRREVVTASSLDFISSGQKLAWDAVLSGGSMQLIAKDEVEHGAQ